MRSAFTGAFAPYICGLIEKKQALGYDYHGSACILRTFDEFCREQFPNETCLTAELAMKWAEQFKTEKNLSRLNRVSVIRELAKYMNSVGEQAYLLPLQLTKKSGRHIPYIYSKEDLSKLFKEIDSQQPSLRAPTKHLVVCQYWVRGHHLLKYNRFSRMALKIQRMFSSNGKSAFDGNSFFHKICRDIRFRQNLYAGRSRQYFCSENSGKSRGVSDGSCIGNSF